MHSLRIPSDLNYVVNKIVQTPTDDLTDVVNFTVKCIQRNHFEEINLQLLANKLNVNLEVAENFLSVLITVIKWLNQYRSFPDKDIKNELIEYGFTGEWINHLFDLLTDADPSFVNSYAVQIVKLNWRIDISLHNNELNRAVSPTILWSLRLSNGKHVTLEITLKKFHEIRFTVTTLLKELGFVKNNSLVKK